MTWATTLLLAAAFTPQVDEELAPYAPEIFGEPETASIDVRVVTSDSTSAPEDLRLIVVYADAPRHPSPLDRFDTIVDVSPYERKRRGWPQVETLALPTGRPIGLVAYSPSHGLVETVLQPSEITEQGEDDSAALTLRLPAPQRLAALQVEAAAAPDRWYQPLGIEIRLQAPRTGVILETGPLGHTVGPVDFRVPAGEYHLAIESYRPEFPSLGIPRTRPTADVSERLTLRPGESRRVRRHLDVGAPFSLRVDVRNLEADVEADFDWSNGWLAWVSPVHDSVGQHFWTATATIERIDVTSLELPAWFGWHRARCDLERYHFPLGRTIYSTRRYTPGTYRLTIRSPRIETTSHVFELGWSDRRWGPDPSEAIRIQVEARD